MGRKDIPSGYSQPAQVRRSADGEIAVYNNESAPEPSACAIYFLGFDLRVRRVGFTDQFVTRHAQLVESAKVQNTDLQLEADRLLDSVLYWTPQGWVSAPSKH
jgi:hypothetical protein